MSLDLDAYLRRIGYEGPRSATLEVLQALHALHPAAIPFENLDSRFGVTPRLDLAGLQDKLVHRRRGGYCFEQNGLFKAVLEALGFQVTPLIARVRWRQPPDAPDTARTHMLLKVDVAGEAFVADVGFGGLTLTAPLRLAAGVEQATPHETFRLVRTADYWEQQGRLGEDWAPTYRFTLDPAPPVDYEMGNWYCATSPASHFTYTLIAVRSPPGRRLTLLDAELAERGEDGRSVRRRIEHASELAEVLREVFHIDPPEHARLDAVATPAMVKV